MACAPEETQSPELLALKKNSSNLCKGITSISTVTHFAQSLVEQSFITFDASRVILRTMNYSEEEKCDRLLDAVREQVRTDPAKFESFVGILRQEPALKCYTDILTSSRGECYNMLVCSGSSLASLLLLLLTLSEGYSTWFLCLSVKSHLSSGVFVCPVFSGGYGTWFVCTASKQFILHGCTALSLSSALKGCKRY